jgi:hypothetical protein
MIKFLTAGLFIASVSAFPSFVDYSNTPQHKIKVLDVNTSYPFGQDLVTNSAGAWTPPGNSDVRGPCPGLNSLANHGILPHSGSGITKQILVDALVKTFNVVPGLAGALFDQAAGALGTNNANGEKELSLLSLRTHNVIEHDASLTRYDFGDAGKDNFTPQKKLVDQLKSFAVNGVLDWTSIAKARLLRIQQEKESDPNFVNGLKESATAIGEAVVAIRLLGDGNVLRADWVDSWFLKEQIPSDWKTSTTQYGPAQFAADAAKLKACIDKITLGASKC